MNKAILIGRLTDDPKTDWEQVNGAEERSAVAKYTLAVDRRNRNNGTDFIRVTSFGRSAEFAEKYFRKGMRVAIEGHIHADSYTNKNGEKVYAIEVIAENQEFADGKKDEQ